MFSEIGMRRGYRAKRPQRLLDADGERIVRAVPCWSRPGRGRSRARERVFPCLWLGDLTAFLHTLWLGVPCLGHDHITRVWCTGEAIPLARWIVPGEQALPVGCRGRPSCSGPD